MRKLTKIRESFEAEVIKDLVRDVGPEMDAFEVARWLAGKSLTITARGECERPQDIDPLLNSMKEPQRLEDGKVRLRVGGRTADWTFDLEDASVRSLAKGGQAKCGNYLLSLA